MPSMLAVISDKAYAMTVNLVQHQERSRSGGWINFAVFDARSSSGTRGVNSRLLPRLPAKAKLANLRTDQSALVCASGDRMQFFDDSLLVGYPAKSGLPRWAHTIDV